MKLIALLRAGWCAAFHPADAVAAVETNERGNTRNVWRCPMCGRNRAEGHWSVFPL